VELLDLDNYGLHLILLVASPILLFSGYCIFIIYYFYLVVKKILIDYP